MTARVVLFVSPGDATPTGRGGAGRPTSASSSSSVLRLPSRAVARCVHRRPVAISSSSTTTSSSSSRRARSRYASVAASSSSRSCDLYDVSDVLTPYATAWDWQKALLNARLDALASDDDDDGNVAIGSRDCLLLVQHLPVVTLGTGSTSDNLKFDPDSPTAPFPVHRTERGGEATYHGPGQLVLYPIINLQVRGATFWFFYFMFSEFYDFCVPLLLPLHLRNTHSTRALPLVDPSRPFPSRPVPSLYVSSAAGGARACGEQVCGMSASA